MYMIMYMYKSLSPSRSSSGCVRVNYHRHFDHLCPLSSPRYKGLC